MSKAGWKAGDKKTIEEMLEEGVPSVDTEQLFTNSRNADVVVWTDGTTYYADGSDNLIDSGTDASTVIQAAIDDLSTDGGKVVLSKGTFEYRQPINLAENTKLVGQGKATVLEAVSKVTSTLNSDASSGQKDVVVDDASDFQVGDWITLYESGFGVAERNQIASINSNTITMTTNLSNTYNTADTATLTTYNPAIYVNVNNVSLESFKVDGKKANQVDASASIDVSDAWGSIQFSSGNHAVLRDITVVDALSGGFSFDGYSDVQVSGGEVSGCTLGGCTGLNFVNANHLTVTGLVSHDNDDDGIEADEGASYVQFNGCTAYNNAAVGIKVIPKNGYGWATGCIAYANYKNFLIGDYGGRGLGMTGCISKDSNYGVMVGKDATITGNYFEVVGGQQAITLHHGTGATIVGNTFYADAPNTDGILFRVEDAEDVLISGNRIRGYWTEGVYIPSSFTADYVFVKNNDVSQASFGGSFDAIDASQNAHGRVINNEGVGLGSGETRTFRKTVNYDDTSPVTVADIEDGYAVTDVWAEVTTTWDGSVQMQIGDDSDVDGFLCDSGGTNNVIDLTNTGYYGLENDQQEAYLWDNTDGHKRTKVYESSDTIDTTISSDGSQGQAIIYVKLTRIGG